MNESEYADRLESLHVPSMTIGEIQKEIASAAMVIRTLSLHRHWPTPEEGDQEWVASDEDEPDTPKLIKLLNEPTVFDARLGDPDE